MTMPSNDTLVVKHLAGLLDAAPDAMVVVNEAGCILTVNTHTLTLFGYTRDELVGQRIEVLVPQRFAGVHLSHRESYGQHPHPRPMGTGLELYGVRKDGKEFPVEISLSPLETEEGMLITSAVRDVSDRKRLEASIRQQNQELEQQNRRVQEANRMKSEFLANMSHELRTPLNSIIGFAEMMHDGTLGSIADDHREYLGDILTSARHLLRLINDVLDLSKVESGTMEFFPERVDLRAMCVELRDMVRLAAAEKRIDVEIDVDADVQELFIDASKLKQVLSNFLSNALKFTAEGGRVDIRARAEGPDAFRLEVEDTGIGIREEDVSRLFVEFQQLDAGTAKKYQGTGLGLALTKRIVEAQGGRVGVTSSLGHGSTFYTVLPRIGDRRSTVADRKSGPSKARPSPLVGQSVFVIDDDAAALKLVDAALRQRGFQPTCLSDPQVALKTVTTSPPDLLILDLQMPGLPGSMFLQRLRELPNCHALPVIIWTVRDVSASERQQLLERAEAVVLKREGGLAALLDCISTFLVQPDDEGESSNCQPRRS